MSGTIRIADPGPRPAFPGPWAVPADIRDELRARRRGRFPAGAGRENFGCRHGRMGDLLPLVGDGLPVRLTPR